MTPERDQRIGQLFDTALEQAPEDRAAFWAAACGADVALRAEVEQLLAHQEESEQYLAQSAWHISAALLAQGKPVTAIGRQIRPFPRWSCALLQSENKRRGHLAGFADSRAVIACTANQTARCTSRRLLPRNCLSYTAGCLARCRPDNRRIVLSARQKISVLGRCQ